MTRKAGEQEKLVHGTSKRAARKKPKQKSEARKLKEQAEREARWGRNRERAERDRRRFLEGR
jgi:hypothetical protein